MSFDCYSYADIKDLEGKTFGRVAQGEGWITFYDVNDKPMYRMQHEQDCCESVTLEEVFGDLSDLEGTPILLAECVSTHDRPQDRYTVEDDEYFTSPESETWTFYKFSTIKGSVTLRWYGTSNGYYSETVEIKCWSTDDE